MTWACQGCLLPDAHARGVILVELVAVAEGTIPNWEIGADFGS